MSELIPYSIDQIAYQLKITNRLLILLLILILIILVILIATLITYTSRKRRNDKMQEKLNK